MKGRVVIDTEFNGFGGELISMALVDVDSPDRAPFYEVLECSFPVVPWVEEHVIPVLNKNPVSKDVFTERLYLFLSRYKGIHIIADWPEDIKYFCESLLLGPGQCMPTPPEMTFEINRHIEAKSSLPHNALADAYAIAAAVKTMESIGHF